MENSVFRDRVDLFGHRIQCNVRDSEQNFVESKTVLSTGYTAVIRRDDPWWIGWIEEVPGVNSQGETREELISNLREALAEAIEMNRKDARNAAGESFEEVAIQP